MPVGTCEGVCFPALALKDILNFQQRKAKMGDDAVIDAAFKKLLDNGVDAGGNLRGLWRVQKLEIVGVPKGQEGKFYEGDCYIHFDKNPVEEHVHFWIGNECSVDEQAVAAIKAVELDNLFGGLPVQHREVQGFESKRFKDQFPDGIMIKKGGMESGLKKAETNAHEAKLFKISGGMRPVMQEVDMAWSSMNHGDVFVLVSCSHLLLSRGSGASGQEKMTAGDEDEHVAVVHRGPGHVHLLHHRSHPPGYLEELCLVSVRLGFLQPSLHPAFLDHYPIRELVLEPLRFEALHLSMLNRKSSKQVVKLHSLDCGDRLFVNTALVSDPEVNVLFDWVLIEVDVTIALIELALLTFWNFHNLELLHSPEASQVPTGVHPLVEQCLEGSVDDGVVSHFDFSLLAGEDVFECECWETDSPANKEKSKWE